MYIHEEIIRTKIQVNQHQSLLKKTFDYYDHVLNDGMPVKVKSAWA